MGTSATAPTSPPVYAPSVAPESCRATTRRGKKQNVVVWGLKTLISMCRSNDALICETHQQMSQQLSTLEECQRDVLWVLRPPSPLSIHLFLLQL
jgi:hypothetical protein